MEMTCLCEVWRRVGEFFGGEPGCHPPVSCPVLHLIVLNVILLYHDGSLHQLEPQAKSTACVQLDLWPF